ncbi:hypothetical protein RJ639_008440, partial [Escallonia herrerae]
EDIAAIFNKADKNQSGTLNVEDFREVMKDICESYPQGSQGDVDKQLVELDIEKFKMALSKVDSQMKSLPATAQVVAQQGEYLTNCFNRMEECEMNPEGPLRFRGSGRLSVPSFQVQALWTICSVGWRTNSSSTSRALGFNWKEHPVALVLSLCKQASYLAHEGVGGVRLGKEMHFWKGLGRI